MAYQLLQQGSQRGLLGSLAAWLVAFAAAGSADGQEWTRFRGPNGTGIGQAKALPAEWTDEDYLWKVELPGPGHSCPVLWGDRLFLTCGDEGTGERMVLAYDANTGKSLWTRRFPSQTHRKHALNSLATSTPAVDEQRVYVAWATPEEFIVQALDHDGKSIWRVDLGPFKSGHGFGASPIVVGDVVIMPNEQEGDSFLLALDCRDGSIRWRIARDSKTTYTTPCVRQAEDGRIEVIFTNFRYGVTAVDVATGEIRWEKGVFPAEPLETAIGSPILADQLVFATSGWLGRSGHVVAVKMPGGDLREPVESHRFDRATPLSTTPLAVNNLVFLWADEGIVTCADLKTQKIHWRRRVGGTYYGSPIYADGKIYCISADGEAVVLAASADYQLLGRTLLGDPSNSTPAIAHGRMYLRTVKHLMALGPKE